MLEKLNLLLLYPLCLIFYIKYICSILQSRYIISILILLLMKRFLFLPIARKKFRSKLLRQVWGACFPL